MFILEILLGLKSMQGDVTCAFLHADLEENETIYVDMPMGFTVTSQVNLLIGETTMKLSVHEDNSGALVLVKTLPPQFTPRSKYYAIKTIWFHEEIHKRCVQLLKINTVEQLGDIFTKGLVQVPFEYLRKKIIG